MADCALHRFSRVSRLYSQKSDERVCGIMKHGRISPCSRIRIAYTVVWRRIELG